MKYIGLFDEKEDIVTKEKLDAVEAAIPLTQKHFAAFAAAKIAATGIVHP